MSRYSRLLFAISIALASVLQLQAQNFSDALRYSRTEALGTARNLSVGGAMGALGADFGVLGINPAGTGAYRSSEFVLTGAVFATNTKSTLVGGGFPPNSETGSRFVISNFGIVFATRPKNNGKLKASNFALGYNKTGEYTRDFGFSGRNRGSITDRFAENALGLLPSELSAFEEGLAFNTGAIYDFDEDRIYETDYQLNPTAAILRSQDVRSRGSSSEIFISYGANFNEKLLFGLTLGVPLVNYEEDKTYEEEDDASDPVPYFNALRFEESLSTSGSGFNARFGFIYKPTKWINVGAAFNTGSRLKMTDNFGTFMRYDFTDTDRQIFEDESPEGSFNYALKTPWSVTGNLGAVIKQHGFLVAQIEYIDYTKSRFDYSVRDNGNQFDDFEQEVNDEIKANLSSSIKLSFGGEFAWKKLRLRGGVNLEQQPFADDNSFSTGYTAGIGVRFERVFIDFGWQHMQADIGYLPYEVNTAVQPFVQNEINNNRFFLTFGYKWL